MLLIVSVMYCKRISIRVTFAIFNSLAFPTKYYKNEARLMVL